MSYNQPTYPPAQPGYPAPAAPPPPVKTSGLAIAGFILAFLIAPIGFILSLIGVFTTGGGRKKGKGLAISGLIISLLIMGGGTAAVLALKNSTLIDPGCTAGKAAILDNANNVSGTDAGKQALQKMIDELKAAASKATHDDVRNAMTALADDYTQLLTAVNAGTNPDASLQGKISTDATKIDSLCTAGA